MPRVARKEVLNYFFLAACVKYAGDRFRPDAEGVAKELGISPSTVGQKLSKLRKRLNAEGASFGVPDLEAQAGDMKPKGT